MNETFCKEITKEEFPELEELEGYILGGALFEDGKPAGKMGFRHKVDLYKGIKFEIFSREHPPPHFHVSYQGQSAAFSIDTCERLRGNRGLEWNESAIRKWWKDNKEKLTEIWKRTRSTNCPVGKIKT